MLKPHYLPRPDRPSAFTSQVIRTSLGSEWPRSDGADIDAVERGRRGDEQPVPLRPAECHVGDHLRDLHLAQQIAVGRKAVNAVAGTGPDIPIGIQAEPV